MIRYNDWPRCDECGDLCEAEPPNGDGCLCDTGDCLFCALGCSGQDE